MLPEKKTGSLVHQATLPEKKTDSLVHQAILPEKKTASLANQAMLPEKKTDSLVEETKMNTAASAIPRPYEGRGRGGVSKNVE